MSADTNSKLLDYIKLLRIKWLPYGSDHVIFRLDLLFLLTISANFIKIPFISIMLDIIDEELFVKRFVLLNSNPDMLDSSIYLII
jgi:hypothetical protein